MSTGGYGEHGGREGGGGVGWDRQRRPPCDEAAAERGMSDDKGRFKVETKGKV